MEGMKKRSKKENDDLIALMLDVGIDTPFSPELTKTCLSKEAVDKCIAAVYATLVIPHPTADDQPKCVACKTVVALHMMMPKNLAKEKIHELDICNTCMLVAEAEGVIFIDNPASCGCLAARHGNCLDCSSCYIKKLVKERTGATCNKCGVDLGIGLQLLGMIKEWMILSCYSCNICKTPRSCAIEGWAKYPQVGCSGHCLAHATLAERTH